MNTYIVVYLVSIVAANILVAHFGPSFAPIGALLFIGLDLTCRDKIHDGWKTNLFAKMTTLIAIGSVMSYALNGASGKIALGSFVAFFAASAVDTVTYQLLKERSKMVKVNGSNVLSAAVDSVVFPTVAFGVFLPSIVALQFVAKVLGGLFWFAIIERIGKRSK